MQGDWAKWWIVDIPIAQRWPTTLERDDQGIPKGNHGVPQLESSKDLSESPNREASNHRKNEKNDLQLNTPDPQPLKSLHGFRLYYLVCCFLAHTSAWLQTLLLGVLFPGTNRSSELRALPQLHDLYLHTEMPVKPVPLYRQDPWLPLLHG
jgi:hypothetical protein